MSIADKIQTQIQNLGAGSVFCAQDFLSLGSRGNLDVILHRLSQKGKIRKLGLGLYDNPIKSPVLGDLKPDISQVIQAYTRRTGYTFVLDPAGSANALNLTTQVPAHLTYFTNGNSQTVTICGIQIQFVRVTPKKLVGAGTSVALVIQALYYFGQNFMPKKLLKKLAQNLSSKDIKLLNSIKNKTMGYISPQIDQLIQYAKQ